MSTLLKLGIKAVLVGGAFAVMGVGGGAVALISSGGAGFAVGTTSTVGIVGESPVPTTAPEFTMPPREPSSEPTMAFATIPQLASETFPQPTPPAPPSQLTNSPLEAAPLPEASVTAPALQLSLAQPDDISDPDILGVGKEIQVLGTNPHESDLTVVDVTELTPEIGLPDGCPEGSYAIRDTTSYDALVGAGTSVVVGAFTLQFERLAENQDSCLGGPITFTWS